MNTNKPINTNSQLSKIGLLVLIGTYWYLFGIGAKVFAQEFSLSVSPPITQILIKPGTKVTQTYQISSNGEAGLYSIHLFPFLPGGENGQIDINEQADVATNPQDTGWFSILQPQVKFGEKFNVPSGSTTTVVIQIEVPPEATQKDYYYSVIFQSENEKGMGQSVSQTYGRIGSNLLMSVVEGENPFRIAEVQEFSAPIIVDSLGKIDYSVILKNVGRTLFKPTGKIAIGNFLSKKVTNLEIAPQNVLAFSERKILCLKEESLIDCTYDSPVLLGLYQAKLGFTLDGQDKTYQAEVTTLALPFSLIAVLIVIFIIFRIIKARMNLDKHSQLN